MYTIVYDEDRIVGVYTSEHITDKPHITVEELPVIKPYRERLAVRNGKLVVEKSIVDLNTLKEIEFANIRQKRETMCFSIVNRGQLWYNKLSQDQIKELDSWYNDWLNITLTYNEETGDFIIPETPSWIS